MGKSPEKLGRIEAIGFDVYGTLIDVAGVSAQLCAEFGQDRGVGLAARWREKQLECSFRRGLMGRYKDFGACTRQALRWVCAEAGLACAPETEGRLLGAFAGLPAFADAAAALAALREAKAFRLCAFSNGTRQQVADALGGAGLRGAFDDIVSVDEVATFKPAPEVYAHFVRRAQASSPARALLVSANMFDAIGAAASGMAVAWVNRAGAPFEEWEFAPTVELGSLADLPPAVGCGHP